MKIEIEPTASIKTADRALGGLEHTFWAHDRHSPLHFCLVGEITGIYSPEQWKLAFIRIVNSHPLLKHCISLSNGEPKLRLIEDFEFPFRLSNYDTSAEWEKEVQSELQLPFAPLEKALIRAVVLSGPVSSKLILTAHHSTLDGLSLATVIRDVAAVLSGQSAPQPNLTLPADELLKLGPASAKCKYSSTQILSESANAAERRSMRRPIVKSVQFDSDVTAQLLQRCRDEGTTVHAALSVAIAFSRWQLQAQSADRTVAVFSPINIRKELGIGYAVGLLVSGGVTAISPQAVSAFWSMARQAQANLANAQHLDFKRGLSASLCTAVQHGITPYEAFDLFGQAFRNDIMLTNLGIFTENSRGDNNLLKLWGPCVTMGDQEEQTIGAVTCRGQLRLVYTSYSPVLGFLDCIVKVLKNSFELPESDID